MYFSFFPTTSYNVKDTKVDWKDCIAAYKIYINRILNIGKINRDTTYTCDFPSPLECNQDKLSKDNTQIIINKFRSYIEV